MRLIKKYEKEGRSNQCISGAFDSRQVLGCRISLVILNNQKCRMINDFYVSKVSSDPDDKC